jgi:hypothetical protein
MFAQHERLSEHLISYNVNEKQKKIKTSLIYIIIDNDIIYGREGNGKFYFPVIEKPFLIVLNINKLKFIAGPFEPEILNANCDLDFWGNK